MCKREPSTVARAMGRSVTGSTTCEKRKVLPIGISNDFGLLKLPEKAPFLCSRVSTMNTRLPSVITQMPS